MSFYDTPEGAVDSAVLFHLSKSGGVNTGADLTQKRLSRMLEQGALTGETLHALMVDATTRAAESAEHRAGSLRGNIAYKLERLNQVIDSARLEGYIETLKEGVDA